MSMLDVRKAWKKGALFMSKKEYEDLTEEYGGWPVSDCLNASCRIADAAIIKMIEKSQNNNEKH